VSKALDQQVGGKHYKDLKIQPIEYAQANQMNACEFSVVKYITRHKFKDGLKDLEKGKHFIDMLIQMEYPQPEKEDEIFFSEGMVTMTAERYERMSLEIRKFKNEITKIKEYAIDNWVDRGMWRLMEEEIKGKRG